MLIGQQLGFLFLLFFMPWAQISAQEIEYPLYDGVITFRIQLNDQFGDPVPYASATVGSRLDTVHGMSDENGLLVIEVPSVKTSVEEDAFPAAVRLHANYPNPFNPTTTIEYEIPEPGNVRLDIFSISGQHVRTLVDGWETGGLHRAVWDARDYNGRGVAAGIYFYRLQAFGRSLSNKMLLMDGNVQPGNGIVQAAKSADRPPRPEYISYTLTAEKEGYETLEEFFLRPGPGIKERSFTMKKILTNPPVADAGPDRIAYAGSYITLTGSGEARDGRVIQGYNWYSLEDSTKVYIAYGGAQNVDLASFPFEGDYYLALTVNTEGFFISEPDTMKVTVLPRQESPIENPVVEIWIRYLLDKPEGPLTGDDLAGIKQFSAYYGLGITESLEGLENCVNLERLHISYAFRPQVLRDISAIGELRNLTELSLDHTGITDLAPLRNLDNLANLKVDNNKIEDISPILDIDNLAVIDISRNPLNNLSLEVHIPTLKEKGVQVKY